MFLQNTFFQVKRKKTEVKDHVGDATKPYLWGVLKSEGLQMMRISEGVTPNKII